MTDVIGTQSGTSSASDKLAINSAMTACGYHRDEKDPWHDFLLQIGGIKYDILVRIILIFCYIFMPQHMFQTTDKSFGRYSFIIIKFIGIIGFLLIGFHDPATAASDQTEFNVVKKLERNQVAVRVFDQDLYFHKDDIVGISFPGMDCGVGTRASASLNYALNDDMISSCIKANLDRIGLAGKSATLYISFEFFGDKYNSTLHPEPFLGLFERAALPIFSPNTLTINIQPPRSYRLNSQCKYKTFLPINQTQEGPFPFVYFLSGRLYFMELSQFHNSDQSTQVFCSEKSGASICSMCLVSNDYRIEATLHWFENTVTPASWVQLASTLRQILNIILPQYKDQFK